MSEVEETGTIHVIDLATRVARELGIDPVSAEMYLDDLIDECDQLEVDVEAIGPYTAQYLTSMVRKVISK